MRRQLAKRQSFRVSILEVKNAINIGPTGEDQGRCYNEESLVETVKKHPCANFESD